MFLITCFERNDPAPMLSANTFDRHETRRYPIAIVLFYINLSEQNGERKKKILTKENPGSFYLTIYVVPR